MSIASFFIFSKLKKYLKDKNILLSKYFYANFIKQIIIIDDLNYNIDFKDVLKSPELQGFKDVEDIAEILVTQGKCEVKFKNNQKIIV